MAFQALREAASTSTPTSDLSPIKPEIIPSHLHATTAIQPKSEVDDIVERFHQILVLMNERRRYKKDTIASLAQLMNLQSVGELESVFLGQREPSFEFISRFCMCFGVNKDWLIKGRSTPFRNSDETYYDPLEYLEEIENSTPERIYFLRCDSPLVRLLSF